MDDVDGLLAANESILPGEGDAMPPGIEFCYESWLFERFQFLADNVMFMMSLAASVFNIAVILVAIKLFKKGGDTVHLFIISMTLGDLLLTTFCIPNEFLMRKSDFFKQHHLCSIRHFGNWMGLAASGLSLTMLNVDKLIFFQWPLSYDRTMSSMRAGLFCISIWLLAFAYVSYIWYGGVVWVEKDCSLQLTKGVVIPFYELFIIFFCILPVTSSLFVSIYLYRLTREKRQAPITGASATVAVKIKSLVFIFATTAWTSISLLPYRVFNISRIYLFDFQELSCEQRHNANWLAWMLLYLLMFNPIVNPMITAIIYAPYRLAIKKFLLNLPIGYKFRRRARETHTDTSYLSLKRIRQNEYCDTSAREMSSLCQLDSCRSGSESSYAHQKDNVTSAETHAHSVGSHPRAARYILYLCYRRSSEISISQRRTIEKETTTKTLEPRITK